MKNIKDNVKFCIGLYFLYVWHVCKSQCACVCMCLGDTYYVPTTLIVMSWIWSPLYIRAAPKSEILGFISPSSRILLVLRSLWIILNLESWWRYKIPRAIPIMISKCFVQFSNELLVGSKTNFFFLVNSKCDFNSVEIYGYMNFKYILWTYIVKENKQIKEIDF